MGLTLSTGIPEDQFNKLHSEYMRTGDNRLRNKLVMSFYSRCLMAANKHFRKTHVTVEDCIQEGVLAVIKAIRSYKPRTAGTPIGYFGTCIENGVQAFVNQSRLIKAPAHIIKYRDVYIGAEPVDDEVLHGFPYKIDEFTLVDKSFDLGMLHEVIASFKGRDYEVLSAYFKDGDFTFNMIPIQEKYGISRQYVCQLRDELMETLGRRLRERTWRRRNEN